jgi:fibronectin-binding autotransporter adhesin
MDIELARMAIAHQAANEYHVGHISFICRVGANSDRDVGTQIVGEFIGMASSGRRRCRLNSRGTIAVAAVLCLTALTASASSITWNVDGGGAWDTSTTNWTGDATIFTDDGTVNVTFDNSAGGTIAISSNVSPRSTTVSASSGTYTFTGGPIDSGTLTKSGGGTLSLGEEQHTFTGKTVIASGQVKVRGHFNAGTAGPLGAPTGADATIDMHPGTTLQVGAPARSVYYSTDRAINLAGAGAGIITLQNGWNDEWCAFGAVSGTGTGPRTLNLACGGDRARIRISGPISDTSDGDVSLDIPFRSQAAAAGRVYLEGTNTFSGPIAMTASRLDRNSEKVLIAGSGSLGSGSYTNTISIGTAVTLDYASSATQTLSGVISGGGSLRVSGPGTVTLLVENMYSGGTTVSGGTLYAGAIGALGTNSVTVGASGLLVMTADNAMGTNATLSLPDDTTETLIMNARCCEVAALTLNSVMQSNGIYRARDYDWMGGSGMLCVGVPAPPRGMALIIR